MEGGEEAKEFKTLKKKRLVQGTKTNLVGWLQGY